MWTTARARLLLAAATAVVVVGIVRPAAAHPRVYGSACYPSRPDLFYNFYVAPYRTGGVPAQLYVAPRPAPPLVGHTYITYQPLMPHEFLYRHSRTYHRRHPGSGATWTYVKWSW